MEDKPTPPSQISDEANQKSEGLNEEIAPPSQPKPKAEECNSGKSSKLRVWWTRGKTAWLLFGELVTLLWAIALWDSYRPKITVSPGGTLNAKSPFGTFFIMQNQGSLPISNIRYKTQLTIQPADGSAGQRQTTMEQNVSVIPQMQSLESYSLSVHYTQVQFKPNSIASTNQIGATNELVNFALLMSFDVSYEPKFFGKRTDTLYFVAVQDVDGNWQWLPTAHQSITDQIIDTNLLAAFRPSPAPVANPTNSGTQVHTNQTRPN